MFGFARAAKVRDLEERLRKVEGDLNRTLLDAEDLFEKARTLLGRTVKRQALPSAAPDAADGATNGSTAPPGMDPISWKIHQRRMRVGARGPTNGGG